MDMEKEALLRAKKQAEDVFNRPLTRAEETMVLLGIHHGQRVANEQAVSLMDNQNNRAKEAMRVIQKRTQETFREISKRY